MSQVGGTLLANKQLAQKPGLRSKVQQVLVGILDTAVEAKKLHNGLLPTDHRCGCTWTGMSSGTRSTSIDRLGVVLQLEADDAGVHPPF